MNLYHRKDIVEMALKVSKETGIPQYTILAAYKAYWDCIKEEIAKFDISSIETEDEVKLIQDSFNLKHIGKLQTNFKTISSINNKIKKKNENTKH